MLDFGLAKTVEAAPSEADMSRSPTLTVAGTQTGVILGTAPYMSPEQVRGQPLDKRADIWTFGCVLYKALVGRRAFNRETVADTLAAIIEAEPDWGSAADDNSGAGGRAAASLSAEEPGPAPSRHCRCPHRDRGGAR